MSWGCGMIGRILIATVFAPVVRHQTGRTAVTRPRRWRDWRFGRTTRCAVSLHARQRLPQCGGADWPLDRTRRPGRHRSGQFRSEEGNGLTTSSSAWSKLAGLDHLRPECLSLIRFPTLSTMVMPAPIRDGSTLSSSIAQRERRAAWG